MIQTYYRCLSRPGSPTSCDLFGESMDGLGDGRGEILSE